MFFKKKQKTETFDFAAWVMNSLIDLKKRSNKQIKVRRVNNYCLKMKYAGQTIMVGVAKLKPKEKEDAEND